MIIAERKAKDKCCLSKSLNDIGTFKNSIGCILAVTN